MKKEKVEQKHLYVVYRGYASYLGRSNHSYNHMSKKALSSHNIMRGNASKICENEMKMQNREIRLSVGEARVLQERKIKTA